MIRIAVGIITLAALYYLIGFANIAQELATINLLYLPIVLFFLLTSLFLSALNVHIMAWPVKKISLQKIVRYYFYSWSVGAFGLGRVGELSIIYWLKKENMGTGEATAIALMDKIITLITLLALAGIGVVLFFGGREAVQLVAIAMGALFLTVFLLFTDRGRKVVKKIFARQSQSFAGFGKTSNAYFKNHKDVLLLNTAVTFGRWVAQTFFTVFLFASFGFNAPFVEVLLVIAVATLLSLVPISINGLGVKEAAFTVLAAGQAWPLTITLSMLTVSLALNYALLICVLVLFAGELSRLE